MYRVNSAMLLLSFLATHVGSMGLVLYMHCQKQHISWREVPYR